MELSLRPVSGTTIRASADCLKYVFDTAPTYLTLLPILLILPRASELTFFDQYFPSPSDPGAYVAVQRKADVFIYQVANHGWSTQWEQQSAHLLAAWGTERASEGQVQSSAESRLRQEGIAVAALSADRPAKLTTTFLPRANGEA